MLGRVFFIIAFLFLPLLGLDISHSDTNILPFCKIYKDYSNKEDINHIKSKKFNEIKSDEVSFGYSPSFTVWLKVELSNPTNRAIEKVLVYSNPLTSYVTFYESNRTAPILKSGLLVKKDLSKDIIPHIKVLLNANEKRVFYIKAKSIISPLIVELKLFDKSSFLSYIQKYIIFTAMFFGALFVIIGYNLIIAIIARNRAYLYYSLYFISLGLYIVFYRAVATLFLDDIVLKNSIALSSFIVALPPLFISLFTKELLNLKEQNRKLNRVLNIVIILYIVFVVLFFLFDINSFRSILPIILLFIFFATTIFYCAKGYIQAYFLIFGWVVFLSTSLFMFLLSFGVFDIYRFLPCYNEFAFILEAILFSIALSYKIRQQELKEQEAKLNKLLLSELKHRVKNSFNAIISIIDSKREGYRDKNSEKLLLDLRDRVSNMKQIYNMLEDISNRQKIALKPYLNELIDAIYKTNRTVAIDIEIDSSIKVKVKYATILAQIVTEAITNSFKYAFNNIKSPKISILIMCDKNRYYLKIEDNGYGFKDFEDSNSIGLKLIETLATEHLNGEFFIDAEGKTVIKIYWDEDKVK